MEDNDSNEICRREPSHTCLKAESSSIPKAMSVEEERVTQVMQALSHPIRRAILITLRQSNACSFSDLMRLITLDSGTLGFHIKRLSDFIIQDQSGKYVLTDYGMKMMGILDEAYQMSSVKGSGIVPTEPLKLLMADSSKRVAAAAIDLALAFGVFLIIPWLGAPFRWSLEALLSSTERNLLFLVLLWIYLTLFEGFSGQTIGKMFIGIKVVRIGGKAMTYEHSAIRNFGKVFLLPVDLYVGMKRLNDDRFIRFFDKFAGTTVITVV